LDHLIRQWLAGELGQTSVATGESPGMTRRTFLGLGATGLAGAVLLATGLGWGLLHSKAAAQAQLPGATAPQPVGPPEPPSRPTSAPLSEATATTEPPPVAQPTATTEVAAQPEATPTAEAPSGQLIAPAGALPVGQSGSFTLPDGYPAVLVHNDKGYSAYVAVCTHEGCEVRPMNGGLLFCPCHGAEFDGNAGAQVLRGPARRPLQSIPLTVDPKGNVYLAG
jgi:Rieske Fe-S protein